MGSGTQTTQGNGSAMTKTPPKLPAAIAEAIDRVCQRAEAAGDRAAKLAAEREEERRAETARWWMRLIEDAGRRYSKCRLENFQATTVAQKRVLEKIAQYKKAMAEKVKRGQNLILFGPTGTGKDHLLVGLAHEAIFAHGFRVLRATGASLFRSLRDGINHGMETRLLAPYQQAPVLILSDPAPPQGTLTPWQATLLYDLVDYRYGRLKPIWVSINVANATEASDRLTHPVFDRLRDGALVLHCNWASWRKAEERLT